MARGFAGLDRLISEVNLSAIARPTSKPSPTPSFLASSVSATGNVKPDRDRAPKAAWVIAGVIAAWILVAVFAGNDTRNPSSSETVAPSASPAVAVSSNGPGLPQANEEETLSSGASSMPSPPSEVEESRPDDFASALPYTANQIAYCLAQDARMEAMKPMVRVTSHREVEHFNQLVSDFNDRCASYRYREEDMTRARNYVSSHRDVFEKQAAHWLTTWRRGTSRKLGSPTDRISSSTEP